MLMSDLTLKVFSSLSEDTDGMDITEIYKTHSLVYCLCCHDCVGSGLSKSYQNGSLIAMTECLLGSEAIIA